MPESRSQSSSTRLAPHRAPRRATLFSALVAALVAALAGTSSPADEPVADLATFPKGEVTVETATGGRFTYRVWIADTEARQRQGLMFVRDLPAEQGMLFVHSPPRPAAFWMKNTYIPLDMLFVDARGRIIKIHERTTPLSLEPLGVDAPVRAVLELRGGEAARRGIRAGDRLRHAAFR
jgi:uncharacterized membrane protein (UPF0127 family)